MLVCVCAHKTAVAENTSAFPVMCSQLFVCLGFLLSLENRNTFPLSFAKAEPTIKSRG